MLDTISGINSSIDLVKKLQEINENVRNVDMDMIMVDLTDSAI